LQVVFFGTPDIAIPTLEALINHKDINVLAAITQPDRPSGRGHKLQAPPVKVLCQKYDIPVFQPEKLSKAPDVVESLRKLEPDLIIMVAFGQILKKEVLAIPKHGVINLHASLLPAYRGAAPINWTIINGDTATGISTMFTEAGLDTGPMLLKEKISLDNNINSQELTKIMAERGAKLTIKTIEQLMAGTIKVEPQDDSQATYAPILDKSMGKIDWTNSANKIHNLIRGLIPWPLAFTTFRGNPIKIWRTELVAADKLVLLQKNIHSPGTIISINKELFVCCGEGSWLEVKEVQPMNKSKLTVKDWSNGAHLETNDKFEF
jgi:methionyl-tRNA formyltransferase